MNTAYFRPRNLIVIALIAILANVAFSRVKARLSANTTTQG